MLAAMQVMFHLLPKLEGYGEGSLRSSGRDSVRPSFKGSVRGRGECSSGPTDRPPISNNGSDSTDNKVEEWTKQCPEISSDTDGDTEGHSGLEERDNDALSNILSDKEEGFSSSSDKEISKDFFKGMYTTPFEIKDCENIAFKIGQVFKDVQTVKDALRDYSVKGGYEIQRNKNDSTRAITICAFE